MAKLRPDRLMDFHLLMGNTRGARNYWVDWYPIDAKLLSGFDVEDSGSLLVDVGGSRGHDLQAFDIALSSFLRERPASTIQQTTPIGNLVFGLVENVGLPSILRKVSKGFLWGAY